jgi:hypothetical protein
MPNTRHVIELIEDVAAVIDADAKNLGDLAAMLRTG